MRTTIDLNDDLFRKAKELAASSGRTLREVIEDALRLAFRSQRPEKRHSTRLPQSKMPAGIRPGVDLDSNASLLDLMEGRDATT